MENWEEKFDEMFVMDYDNGPTPGGTTFLFKNNGDGTMKIAIPEDVKAFIRRLLRQTQRILVDVKQCQRCGEDHDEMAFAPLFNPSGEFAHFGNCPATGQPVLLAIRDIPDGP